MSTNLTKNITIGILAHVDAGKTTLSESILYVTGTLRSRGRVDHGDAFLDTDALEKKRGITIFSKIARFNLGEQKVTLLDTPGHADFSPEMERALRVLDYAVLVISAADLTEGKIANPQVRVIWKLLAHYHVPAFLFVNKMDQIVAWQEAVTGAGSTPALTADNLDARAGIEEELLGVLTRELGSGLVHFDGRQLCADNAESVAVCDDALMERYLEEEALGESEDVLASCIKTEDVQGLIADRKLFPVYFGAALTDLGTTELLKGIETYAKPADYGDTFGAIVYKVTRDSAGSGNADGSRLVWMKLTGGQIAVRDEIAQTVKAVQGDAGTNAAGADLGEDLEAELSGDDTTEPGAGAVVREKIAQIRLYSGDKYTLVTSAQAGDIVAVSGLTAAQTGDGLGDQDSIREELLAPIRTCTVTAQKGIDTFTLMHALQRIEEEEPLLHVVVDEETGEPTVQIMGQVQIQILQSLLEERFGIKAQFGPGRIVYRETIRRPVEGVGHFEPLRHYAEVHLLLEPTAPGSGITFENHCLPNMMDKNWQNLVMTHLQEKRHRGVLTGSELTDMRISLIGGRAHLKHTEGGDFRRATYRAVRQGLMLAENILLEPVMAFHLELPKENLGRALTDFSRMYGKVQPATFEGDTAIVEGKVPAQTLGDYAQDVLAYTGGRGHLTVSLAGYEPCHNAREVLDACAYNPDEDRRNASYSVFCSHGAGTVVTWDRVRDHMHVETGWTAPEDFVPLLDSPYADDFFTFAAQEEVLPVRDTGEESVPDHRRRKAPGEDASFEEREAAHHIAEKELLEIFERTYGPIKQKLRHPDNERHGLEQYWEEEDTAGPAKGVKNPGDPKYNAKKKAPEPMQEYLLVDGYNIIFAWEELKELAAMDIKAARDKLLDILSNYAGLSGETVIVVFDAYKVTGGKGEVYRYHNIDVVFTKEAETADLYIEKTAHTLSKKYRVSVATSDAIEQVIIFGAGALRVSAKGLLEKILFAEAKMREEYL